MLTEKQRRENREPFPLPIKTVESRSVVEHWQDKIWRASGEKLSRLLTAFWQEAYSKGLKDMDRMHEKIDEL